LTSDGRTGRGDGIQHGQGSSRRLWAPIRRSRRVHAERCARRMSAVRRSIETAAVQRREIPSFLSRKRTSELIPIPLNIVDCCDAHSEAEMGHFRPIQPVLPAGPCSLRPESGLEARRRISDRKPVSLARLSSDRARLQTSNSVASHVRRDLDPVSRRLLFRGLRIFGLKP
jgi:hypothetical protein